MLRKFNHTLLFSCKMYGSRGTTTLVVFKVTTVKGSEFKVLKKFLMNLNSCKTNVLRSY